MHSSFTYSFTITHDSGTPLPDQVVRDSKTGFNGCFESERCVNTMKKGFKKKKNFFLLLSPLMKRVESNDDNNKKSILQVNFNPIFDRSLTGVDWKQAESRLCYTALWTINKN